MNDEPTWTPGGGPPAPSPGRNPGGGTCLIALIALLIDLSVLLGGAAQVTQSI